MASEAAKGAVPLQFCWCRYIGPLPFRSDTPGNGGHHRVPSTTERASDVIVQRGQDRQQKGNIAVRTRGRYHSNGTRIWTAFSVVLFLMCIGESRVSTSSLQHRGRPRPTRDSSVTFLQDKTGASQTSKFHCSERRRRGPILWMKGKKEESKCGPTGWPWVRSRGLWHRHVLTDTKVASFPLRHYSWNQLNYKLLIHYVQFVARVKWVEWFSIISANQGISKSNTHFNEANSCRYIFHMYQPFSNKISFRVCSITHSHPTYFLIFFFWPWTLALRQCGSQHKASSLESCVLFWLRFYNHKMQRTKSCRSEIRSKQPFCWCQIWVWNTGNDKLYR